MNGEQRSTCTAAARPARWRAFPDTLRCFAMSSPSAEAVDAAAAHPPASAWLAARRTWQAGGADNSAGPVRPSAQLVLPSPPLPEPALRLRVGDVERTDASAWRSGLPPAGPALAVLISPISNRYRGGDLRRIPPPGPALPPRC